MVKMSHKNLRIIAFLKIKWSTSFFCGLSKKSSKFYFWKLINFIVWKQLDTMAINLRLSAFSIHLQITSVIIIRVVDPPGRSEWHEISQRVRLPQKWQEVINPKSFGKRLQKVHNFNILKWKTFWKVNWISSFEEQTIDLNRFFVY